MVNGRMNKHNFKGYEGPVCACCNPQQPEKVTKAYSRGIADERQRIINWIEANRSCLELSDDVKMYRDHFDSEFLLEFIRKKSNGN